MYLEFTVLRPNQLIGWIIKGYIDWNIKSKITIKKFRSRYISKQFVTKIVSLRPKL
jgi:hypothetical protein